MIFNRKEFEDRYLNKLVYVRLFDGDEFKGYLYSTNDYMKTTNIPDVKNHYFVANDIRENKVRFCKSHITNIRLLSGLNIHKSYKLGER